MISTGFRVLNGVESDTTILSILLALSNFIILAFQFKLKLAIFQSTTCQGFLNRELCVCFCSGISVLEGLIIFFISNFCHQVTLTIVCDGDSRFDHFGVIFHTTEFRIFFGDGVVISTYLSILNGIESDATILCICLCLMNLIVCTSQFKFKFPFFEVTTF